MALYVYNATTGALVSWCQNDTDPVADQSTLTAKGLAVVTGLPPLDATHAWSSATKTVVSQYPTPSLNQLNVVAANASFRALRIANKTASKLQGRGQTFAALQTIIQAKGN
jgi:hypothetical protein